MAFEELDDILDDELDSLDFEESGEDEDLEDEQEFDADSDAKRLEEIVSQYAEDDSLVDSYMRGVLTGQFENYPGYTEAAEEIESSFSQDEHDFLDEIVARVTEDPDAFSDVNSPDREDGEDLTETFDLLGRDGDFLDIDAEVLVEFRDLAMGLLEQLESEGVENSVAVDFIAGVPDEGIFVEQETYEALRDARESLIEELLDNGLEESEVSEYIREMLQDLEV